MILIVDDRARRRSLILRDLFRAAGVPCALCAFDNMTQFRSAPVTVFFAHDETSVSLAAVRAGRTELVAVNVSGRRMFHPEASVWDGEPDEKLVAFAKARNLPMTLEDTRPDNAEAAREYLERFA